MSQLTHKSLNYWLERFDKIQGEFPGSVVDSFCFGDPNSHNHLVVISAIHGDEIGSLPVVVDLAEKIRTQNLGLKMTVALGCRQAILSQKRFLKYDLNRNIKISNINDPEILRAQELIQVVSTATALIDFHQTIQPTESAFYIFPPNPLSINLCKVLKGTDVVVEDLSLAQYGEMSLVEFALGKGIPAVAIELGQKGITVESYKLGTEILHNAIGYLSSIQTDIRTESKLFTVNQVNLRVLKILEDICCEDSRDCLVEGLSNLQAIAANQLLVSRFDGTKVFASQDGFILFPKYPKRSEDQIPLESFGKVLCSIAVKK